MHYVFALAVKSGTQDPAALIASVNHRGVVPGAQPLGVPEGDPIIDCLPKLPISELDPIPNLSITHVRRVSRGENLHKGNSVAGAPPFIDGIPAPNFGRSQPPDWRREVRALGKLANAFAADAKPPGNFAPGHEILWFLPFTSHLSSHRGLDVRQEHTSKKRAVGAEMKAPAWARDLSQTAVTMSE